MPAEPHTLNSTGHQPASALFGSVRKHDRRTSRAMLTGLAARSESLLNRPKVTRLHVRNSTIEFRYPTGMANDSMLLRPCSAPSRGEGYPSGACSSCGGSGRSGRDSIGCIRFTRCATHRSRMFIGRLGICSWRRGLLAMPHRLLRRSTRTPAMTKCRNSCEDCPAENLRRGVVLLPSRRGVDRFVRHAST